MVGYMATALPPVELTYLTQVLLPNFEGCCPGNGGNRRDETLLNGSDIACFIGNVFYGELAAKLSYFKI